MEDYDKDSELIVEGRDYSTINDGHCNHQFKNEFLIKQSKITKVNFREEQSLPFCALQHREEIINVIRFY